jgi:TM2 domain-containing membrane protein YozV
VTTTAATGEKSFVTALLLCLFLGWFGAHRFYVGKVRTGILMLLTFGGLCVWQLIDVVMIANGNVRDDKGLALVR